MFFISKEDKKIWSEYVSNINSYSLNFNLNKKLLAKNIIQTQILKKLKAFQS
jgi:hypothetical protein